MWSLVRPWLALWRKLMRATGLKTLVPRTKYDRDVMRNLLVEYAMRVEPKLFGLADVYAEGRSVATDVINPLRLKASSSMFLARYKIFLASGVALGWAALVNLVSRLFHAEAVIVPYLGVLFYPIVLLILWWMFDDLLTATVSPLPLIAMRLIIRGTHGFQGFVVAVVLTALHHLPGRVVLHTEVAARRRCTSTSTTRSRPSFPTRRGHEPYWLKGKYYWVWRYVTLAPAELLKFWEKDWERLEVWVRADGEDRGKIEYVVTDTHYRELWFKYESLVGEGGRGLSLGGSQPRSGHQQADQLGRGYGYGPGVSHARGQGHLRFLGPALCRRAGGCSRSWGRSSARGRRRARSGTSPGWRRWRSPASTCSTTSRSTSEP